ncbi:MAG: adenylyltransferase [Deltaproteobacteria bacterium RBG_16_42_7]|nr:MAG: adenylyltransferase [Deltaproteobacteria bacterium RBG_16_42_7]
MLTWLSKNIFYPLWDIKDRSILLTNLKELEKTQWESEEELKIRQWGKLKTILQYAYGNCKYYKSVFDKNQITPAGIHRPQDLSKIPVLTKKQIQDNTDNLISQSHSKEKLISAKTGGSTGKSLKIYFDKQCQEMRNAAAIRSDRWAGWDIGMKMAALWGNPPIADTLKKKIRNGLYDRVIYLDTMNINEKSMLDFVRHWYAYKPQIIFGHSHSIFIFAKFIQENKIKDIKPRGIISSSMMLLPKERAVIEKVFSCKVTNRYGCEEVGLIACECEKHDGMHLNTDHLYIEFIKEDGTPAQAGEEGAIVITDLINHGMPLIRYRIEDVGAPTDRKCSCGRGLPLMEKVAGRVADFLVRKDGSLVAGVSLVERTLTAIKGIEQMQIVQESTGEIVLHIVKMKEYNPESENDLMNEFLSVFGDNVKIKVHYVERIPQEQSGKYRFSICKIKGVN